VARPVTLRGMDASTLRELQAPLKDSYRTDPSTARTPLTARADYRDPGVTTTVEGWAGPVRAGLHSATGGDGTDACSGEMRLTVRSASLRAEGMFDARGTLGVDRDVPVGVQDIVVVAEIDSDADDAALERLATATERYCVVGQSLRQSPRFVVQRAATLS
jgi:uncharacterized OsmC-like protein